MAGDGGSTSESEGESSSDSGTSGVGESETGDDEPWCAPASIDACAFEASDELQSCFDACSCDDLDCAADCHATLESNYWACVEQACPNTWSDSECWGLCSANYRCEDACDIQNAACLADVDGCDPNMCEYQRLDCADVCLWCEHGGRFEYAHEGSCQIALPGPLSEIGADHVELSIGNQSWALGEADLGCDDPDNPVAVWPDENHLLLCEAACAAFATSGLLGLVIGYSACE